MVAHIALGQDLGGGGGVLGVDHHGAEPLAFALHVAHDDGVAFGAPEERTDQTFFGFGEFYRLALERSLNGEDAIAIGDLLFGVAAVEGFDPVKTGGLAGVPVYVARTRGHASKRNALLHGEARDLELDESGPVPDFNLFGEILEGEDVGKGLVNLGDEDVLTVGRGLLFNDEGRLANGGHLPVDGVY